MIITTFHSSIYVRTLVDGFRNIDARTYWDRTVLIMFYVCLLLLSHALIGFRLVDEATPAVDRISIDALGSGEAVNLQMTPLKETTSLPGLYYTPNYDPFNLNSLFNSVGYEDDDQPFALKIHLGNRIEHSKLQRCQASSGVRCRYEHGQ